MKKIVQVPIHPDKILNLLALGNSYFEFLIYKRKTGLEYYIEIDDIFKNIIESKGYVLEEMNLDLEGFIDCGGKLGYDFSQRDIVINPKPNHIQLEELIEIL